MWVNLHALPVDQAQYTALVGDGDDFDEIDFVASRHASLEDLIFLAGTCDDAEGYEGCSIAGMINQSAGFVIFQ